MKLIYSSVLIIITAFILTGCAASVAYLNDGVPKYQATNPDMVKIFSERNIDRKIIELGYISVHITDNPNGDLMKELMRKKAAEIGADAIVNFQIMGALADGIAVKYMQ